MKQDVDSLSSSPATDDDPPPTSPIRHDDDGPMDLRKRRDPPEERVPSDDEEEEEGEEESQRLWALWQRVALLPFLPYVALMPPRKSELVSRLEAGPYWGPEEPQDLSVSGPAKKVDEPPSPQIRNSPVSRLFYPKRAKAESMPTTPTTPPQPWTTAYGYYAQMVQRLHDEPVSTTTGVTPTTAANDADAVRRRTARVLTGKHVRHGTGASPSTLLTLRQKIEERQRAKERTEQLVPSAAKRPRKVQRK